MKKKQMLSVALTAAMALTMLAGCGSSSSGGASSADTSAGSTAAAAETTQQAAVAETTSDSAAASSTAATTAGNTDIKGNLNLIHYLTEDNKIAALNGLVDGFQKEYPDVKVNVEAMSMDNYTDVIKLRFSTNEAPDIIFGQPKSNTDLIDNGLIMQRADYGSLGSGFCEPDVRFLQTVRHL